MQKIIKKNAQLLALFAIACTTFIALVDLLTKDKIVAQQQKQLLSTLASIIDPNTHNNAISKSCFTLDNQALGATPKKIYLATMNEKPVAAAITTTAPDGYNGNITLLVAVNVSGSVSGVRTLKHQETPGLGDKIEVKRSPWILNFSEKKMMGENDSRWHVRKDGGMFDQFTGATITPRAVVSAVKRTVKYFNANKDTLFSTSPNCLGDS